MIAVHPSLNLLKGVGVGVEDLVSEHPQFQCHQVVVRARPSWVVCSLVGCPS